MKIDFKIDTEAFESTLVRYKVACEKAWEWVLRQQTRLVAEKLMKFTPPKNFGTWTPAAIPWSTWKQDSAVMAAGRESCRQEKRKYPIEVRWNFCIILWGM